MWSLLRIYSALLGGLWPKRSETSMYVILCVTVNVRRTLLNIAAMLETLKRENQPTIQMQKSKKRHKSKKRAR